MKKLVQLYGKKLVAICLSLILMPSIIAQVGQNLERVRAERIAFFTERMELTTSEAEKFWPVYNDYNSRKEKLNEEGRMLIRYVSNNSQNMENAEIQESLNNYVEIQKKTNDLFVAYNQNFLEILPASKVLKLYIAENQFKQYLLRKLGEARQERQGGRR